MDGIRGDKLRALNLPEPACIIDGVLVEGYTVLSAPRKFGKSWMALQMCYAVAQGGTFLGRKAAKGQAIYLALEDTLNLTASRQRQTVTEGGCDENVYIVRSVDHGIDDGFIEELDGFIEREGIKDLKLVIIDVLAKIDRGIVGRGEDVYHKDYRVGATLKKWTEKKHVALIAMTHVAKKKSDDPYDDTMGTGGVTGSADSLITLRKTGGKSATMSVIGRALPEIDIKVQLNGGLWETDIEDYQLSPIYRAVLQAVDETEGEKVTATDLIIAYDLEDSAQRVGEYLAKHKDDFKRDGIAVQIIRNGNGSNNYRFRRV